jgi:hypothetical protein
LAFDKPAAANLLRTAGHDGVKGIQYCDPAQMVLFDAMGHNAAETILLVAMSAYKLQRALHGALEKGDLFEEAMVSHLPSDLHLPSDCLVYQGWVVGL